MICQRLHPESLNPKSLNPKPHLPACRDTFQDAASDPITHSELAALFAVIGTPAWADVERVQSQAWRHYLHQLPGKAPTLVRQFGYAGGMLLSLQTRIGLPAEVGHDERLQLQAALYLHHLPGKAPTLVWLFGWAGGPEYCCASSACGWVLAHSTLLRWNRAGVLTLGSSRRICSSKPGKAPPLVRHFGYTGGPECWAQFAQVWPAQARCLGMSCRGK